MRPITTLPSWFWKTLKADRNAASGRAEVIIPRCFVLSEPQMVLEVMKRFMVSYRFVGVEGEWSGEVLEKKHWYSENDRETWAVGAQLSIETSIYTLYTIMTKQKIICERNFFKYLKMYLKKKHRRRVFGRLVSGDQESDGHSSWAPWLYSIWRWEKLREGQTSQQHSTNIPFMTAWPDSILSSVKTYENPQKKNT